MTLKLRPTGLGSGIDKDRPDYTVYCGGWDVGRIYETRGGPDKSWRSCRRVGSVEVPRPANNCAPVAPRLLTLTDHPGFDLVAIFIRMGDRADGCYSQSGLMMEVPPVHDTLRNAKSNALRTTAVPQSCREPLL